VTRKYEILPLEERAKLLDALHGIRKAVQWKPGKDIFHLKKRQKMKHLTLSASLLDYHEVISALVGNERNIIYLYEFRVLTIMLCEDLCMGKNGWLSLALTV
jgi:hypothetical protein